MRRWCFLYEDNRLDDTVIDGVVYTIEMSNRVMFAIKCGKMEKFIIECALTALNLDKLENDNFLVINKQLNIAVLGEKAGTKILIDKVEWLSEFKIFGL